MKPLIFPAIPKSKIDSRMHPNRLHNIDYFGGNYDSKYLFIFGRQIQAPLFVGFIRALYDKDEWDEDGIAVFCDPTDVYDMKGYNHDILIGHEEDEDREESPPLEHGCYIEEIEVFHVPL